MQVSYDGYMHGFVGNHIAPSFTNTTLESFRQHIEDSKYDY